MNDVKETVKLRAVSELTLDHVSAEDLAIEGNLWKSINIMTFMCLLFWGECNIFQMKQWP